LNISDYKDITVVNHVFLWVAMSKTAKKNTVDRTRVTWVLAALVAAMTMGTMVLGILEPNKPILSETTTYLAAAYNRPSRNSISKTDIPIEKERWQGVMIHTLAQENETYTLPCLASGSEPAPVVHFVICEDAQIGITKKWVNQASAANTRGQILIGIQLAQGHHEATLEQANAVVALVKDLQSRCRISASRVTVHAKKGSSHCADDPLRSYNWRKYLLN
jgi:hypothetical protein